MNKLFLFIMPFFLLSCTKSETLVTRVQRTTYNHTKKDIIQIIITDVGSDTITVLGVGENMVLFSKSKTIKVPKISLGEIHGEEFFVKKEITYCLSDTTKYLYESPYFFRYNDEMFAETQSDSLYEANLHFELGDSSTDPNPFIKVNFYFNDTIIKIMEKDYSLLQKYPGYYN